MEGGAAKEHAPYQTHGQFPKLGVVGKGQFYAWDGCHCQVLKDISTPRAEASHGVAALR